MTTRDDVVRIVAEARGYTSVRLPWVKKSDDDGVIA